MKKTTPLLLIAVLACAAIMLAFTVNDFLDKGNRSATVGQMNTSSQLNLKNGRANNVKYNPPHGKPGHRCDIADGAPMPSESPQAMLPFGNVPKENASALAPAFADLPVGPEANIAPTGNQPGANPAHGKPGHRCDIAVGAPLNSAPVPQAKASIETKTSNLNPAHGQPGHKCDIAVGAPLNKTVATKQTSSTPALLPTINPAHGQPFHRCDIAVGAPLTGKKSEASNLTASPVTKSDSLAQPTILNGDSSKAPHN